MARPRSADPLRVCLVALALGLAIASTALGGGPAQTTAPDPTGGLLAWADALTARGWVGVAALAVVLSFAAYVLTLRQRGALARETSAITAALKAARKEWAGSRNAEPPK
jgi:hypothetical protein